MKYGRLIEYNKKNSFYKNFAKNEETSSRSLSVS